MKFTDYKHFMIVSCGTANMLQDDINFVVSPPEPVECPLYPNANLTFCGVLTKPCGPYFTSEDYPDGCMHIAVYMDANFQYINPGGK